jgi:probable rRNA maturation factor
MIPGDTTDGPPEPRGAGPQLSLHDHSERHGTAEADMEVLARLLERALPQVQAAPGASPSVLDALDEVEISLLDDPAIAAIHGDFLEDPTPTDVITFHHGEILVSVETAAREAETRGGPPLRETALYIIHGLLHLHGHTDADPGERRAMHAAQDRILDAVWPAGSRSPLP